MKNLFNNVKTNEFMIREPKGTWNTFIKGFDWCAIFADKNNDKENKICLIS